jgi:hypothetical protein
MADINKDIEILTSKSGTPVLKEAEAPATNGISDREFMQKSRSITMPDDEQMNLMRTQLKRYQEHEKPIPGGEIKNMTTTVTQGREGTVIKEEIPPVKDGQAVDKNGKAVVKVVQDKKAGPDVAVVDESNDHKWSWSQGFKMILQGGMDMVNSFWPDPVTGVRNVAIAGALGWAAVAIPPVAIGLTAVAAFMAAKTALGFGTKIVDGLQKGDGDVLEDAMRDVIPLAVYGLPFLGARTSAQGLAMDGVPKETGLIGRAFLQLKWSANRLLDVMKGSHMDPENASEIIRAPRGQLLKDFINPKMHKLPGVKPEVAAGTVDAAEAAKAKAVADAAKDAAKGRDPGRSRGGRGRGSKGRGRGPAPDAKTTASKGAPKKSDVPKGDPADSTPPDAVDAVKTSVTDAAPPAVEDEAAVLDTGVPAADIKGGAAASEASGPAEASASPKAPEAGDGDMGAII